MGNITIQGGGSGGSAPVTTPTLLSSVTVVASGANTLVAASPGQKIYVMAYAITAAGTMSSKFRSGAVATDIWRIDLSVSTGNSGANLSTTYPSYLFSTTAGEALSLNADGAAIVSVSYWLGS